MHKQTREIFYLVKLARAIFELVKCTDTLDGLENLQWIANKTANLLEANEDSIHPDLGLHLVEFVLLKIDHQKNPSEEIKTLHLYESDVEKKLRSLEKQYNSQQNNNN